jgi:hypothetical protein
MSVAHAGGQGKTTVAQLLYIAARKAGVPYRLFSADFVDDQGHSKLGKLYPERVTEFGTGASLTAARAANSTNAALRYWDRMGPIFLEGNAVLDVGANVVQSIVDWAQDRRLSSLMEKMNAPRIDLFCVCKAQRHALDDIAKVLRSVMEQSPFRLNRIFIVLNEVGGPFDEAFKTSLQNQFPDSGLSFVKMPGCQSELWPAIELKGVSIEAILEADHEEVMRLLDVDLWTAVSGHAELTAWVDGFSKTLRDNDIFVRKDGRN